MVAATPGVGIRPQQLREVVDRGTPQAPHGRRDEPPQAERPVTPVGMAQPFRRTRNEAGTLRIDAGELESHLVDDDLVFGRLQVVGEAAAVLQ